MTAFDPSYPTPGAMAYRDGFIVGAKERGLTGIPETLLSWAIDRAIQAQATSVRAGQVFADCYFKVQQKPDWQGRRDRGKIMNREAFLLSEYEKELRRKN